MDINSLDRLIQKADKNLKKYCKKYNEDYENTKSNIEKHIDPFEELMLLDFYLDYYNHVMKYYIF